MTVNTKNMRYGRPYTLDTTIFDRVPGFYAPGFSQYGTKAILQLRKYFWEKKNIGLISEVEVYQDNLHLQPCFYLAGIHPNIWRYVIRPGIEQHVELVTITTYTDGFEIRVKEKTP